MTLEECKEQVAHEYCFQDWGQVCRVACGDEMHDLTDAVAKLYAQEKVKEALRLAADKARVKGIPMDEGGYLKMVDPESILSLETELLNKI